jgi:CTP:molybdopterin cytidylyltransferase MocA/protein-S-isoprenylcysteine O-methyltransferase Ste14
LILRHLLAIAVLPLTVVVIVPIWIARAYDVEAALPVSVRGWVAVVIGAAALIAGAVLFVASLRRFAAEGHGTLAPWDPPTQFVATGPYRYVRNPMISGVLLVLLAEGVLLNSLPHLAWSAAVFIINSIYIPLVEERALGLRFGESYEVYCRNVRRFVPRLSPWTVARPRVVAVIPAAGKSSRFGSDKRRALVDGVPMLDRVVKLMTAAGVDDVRVVEFNPHPERGMFSTIQIGLAGVDPTHMVLVHPADMPFTSPETVKVVIAECYRTRRAVCPRVGDRRGHPLALPVAIVAKLLAVDPTTPLNKALDAVGAVRIELAVSDPGAIRDVDVPADLHAPIDARLPQ